MFLSLMVLFLWACSAFAGEQEMMLISSVHESKDNVVRKYTYRGDGLLGSHTYEQIGWNKYNYQYRYEDGMLTWEYDGDTRNTLTFLYDSEGRVQKQIKNGNASNATEIKWSGNQCISYGGYSYTSDSTGRILTESHYARFLQNNQMYSGTELNSFTYDAQGNVKQTKWEFEDLDARYRTFAMTYQDAVVIKAKDSSSGYDYTISYTTASVPQEYVKLVKEQQRIILHTLNYSAPIIMRHLCFASAGNLPPKVVATPTPTPIPSPTATPTPSPTPPPTVSPVPATPTKITAGNLMYTVKGSSATVTGPVNKTAKTLSIPASIKSAGKTIKVTAIAKEAFAGMKKLKEVTIGKNVGTIGKKAFSGCANLKKITIRAKKLTSSSVGSKAFSGISAKATVKCPSGKKAAYQKILLAKGMKKTVKFE